MVDGIGKRSSDVGWSRSWIGWPQSASADAAGLSVWADRPR